MTRERLLRAVAVGVVLLVLTTTTFTGSLLVRPLPTIDGYYRFIGLHERAEVVRDIFGIPRIEAAGAHDLFFLQGYVTAQDRFAQMEAMRTSEPVRSLFLGPTAPLDRALLDALDAYAAGVTKYIDQHAARRALPAEVAITGRRPGPWTAMHTLAIAAVYLSAASGSVCAAFGDDRTFKDGPLLAADLDSAAPEPGWYHVGLEAPGIRAIGLSLPGVPGIVAGHNGSVAWALFSSGRAGDTYQVVRTLLGAAQAHSVSDLTSDTRMQNGPFGGCLADYRQGVGGLTPYREVLPDRTLVLSGADPARQQQLLSAILDAPDVDVETVRVWLGATRPAAARARIVIDLGDLDASKAAISTGQSGHRASYHYRDQVPLWEAGQLHRLPWTRAEVKRTEGHLVLRPR